MYLCTVIRQFSKIAFFSKIGCNFSSSFPVLSSLFEKKISFLRLLKHYQNRGFNIVCVLLFKEKKKPPNMITGISVFGLCFLSKNGRFVTVLFFKNWFAGTPNFIVFLGVRFLGQVVRKGKFWTPPKQTENID